MATAQTMSHWARPRTKCTDHWSKLKSKSYYHTTTPTGNYICYCRPQHYDPQGQKYSRRPFENVTSLIPQTTSYSRHFQKSQGPGRRRESQPTLAQVGDAELNRQLSEIGSLHLPTAQQWLSENRPWRRSPSASSRRARQGFIYWAREPEESTPTAKKTFRSKGTFLGI